MSPPSRGSSPVDVPEYNTQFEPGPDDNETLWSVLEIIKEDKRRYLVKWEGVDPDTGKPWDPSWVPKRDCTDDLIFEWKLTKAKKDKVLKKKRKSKGEMDAYEPKRLTKLHKAEKSKSNAYSSAPSHKSSSTAGPSRSPPDAPSGKVSPIVELAQYKKRRREVYPLDGDSAGFTESAPQLKKQRKLVAHQRAIISHSPASNDKAESPLGLEQSQSRPGSPREHDGLDVTQPNSTFQGHSCSPGGRHLEIGSPRKKHRSRTSREKEHDTHEPKRKISSRRTQPQRAPSQDGFEPGSARDITNRPGVLSSLSGGTGDLDRGHDQYGGSNNDPVRRRSMDKGRLPDHLHSLGHNDIGDIDFDVADGEDRMNLDEVVLQDHDNDSRSPSPPSPRDLILGAGEGIGTIISETQSSVLGSQPKLHAPESKVSLPQNNGKREGSKRHPKDSESCTGARKDSTQALGPVRHISPAEFESYVTKARSVPPDSQASSIEMFSPNRSQATTKRGVNGQELTLVDPQLRDRSASAQRQRHRAGSDNMHDSGLHDSIEGYETTPSDQALEHRGARIAEAARQQLSSFAPSEPAQRPLNDIISSSISSNLNGLNSQRDAEVDMEDNEVVSETESDQHNQGSKNGVRKLGSQSPAEFSMRHQRALSKEINNPLGRDGSALHSNDADSLGGDKRELDRDETDELGPEDALDPREPSRPPFPTNIFSSAEVNYSLEANGALTQQSAFQLPVIASPVRELNHALGLLNRKSEEIELLKVALKNHQSHMIDLDEELARLKRNLELAEGRYEEAITALNKERAAKVSEEERVEKPTVKDLTTSVEHAESLMELHRENEELKLTRAQLESDTGMLRNLYAQASDAHQTRVVEIKALKCDNDSLREQATTGVKQAHLFWATQVHTLEKELMLSKGAIELLTDQARRTDNDVRTRAALLPMAQREAETAKQEIEDWKAKFMELGRENTRLRLEVKEWEDDAVTRRMKEQEMKEQASALQDELVWMCPWMDDNHRAKCGVLLESREKLREHIYEAGHL